MKYVRIAAFFEVIFLGVLSAIIIIEAKDNTLAVFDPFTKSQIFNNVGGPLSSLGLGMIFGLTSFIGYGGSAPLGEEDTTKLDDIFVNKETNVCPINPLFLQRERLTENLENLFQALVQPNLVE